MSEVFIINIALLIMLIISAFGVLLSRNLLFATIWLMIFSLIMAANYLVLGAPDVAITEAAIGAGISTVLVLAALLLTGEDLKKNRHFIITIAIVLVTSCALIYAISDLPEFGDKAAPANKNVAAYYINESYNDMGIPNIVTSILASYRGYDTMGETFVIFIAGIAVAMIFLSGTRRRKKLSKEGT